LKNDKDFKGWPRTYGKEKASDNSLERDAQRQASPPGKRVSKTGRVYYENRDNRADREANAFPRKIYLKEGGNIYNTRNLFELGGDIMVEPTILQDTPDYLVGTTTMYEMFAEGGEVSKEDFVSKSIVYDNGGESLDRYTVYTPDGSVYGMSETGAGFNQYLGEADEIPKGKHLGKKLKSVPKEIESAVLNRMEFEKGGMMADSSEVKKYAIVDENTDRIYIRNTNKEFIDLKYKELKEIYPNDKLSIIEFEKGGITKGGKVHKSEKV
jgi:hypothetical protein